VEDVLDAQRWARQARSRRLLGAAAQEVALIW
jgi:hypothetical protein